MFLKLVCSVYCDANCWHSSTCQGSEKYISMKLACLGLRWEIWFLVSLHTVLLFRAQGANIYICLTWATVQVFFCSSSLKYMCNWAAHFHIWWCPGGVNAVKSKPIFQVLHHAASLGGFPKRMQNICVGMSKRKSLLPISWFHTAISVMKISEYCKEFSAFCGFGLLYIQYSPHWRGGFHKLQKLVFCLQNL